MSEENILLPCVQKFYKLVINDLPAIQCTNKVYQYLFQN